MDRNIVPKHIAFIMDGNRRWAIKHGLREIEGHRKGENRIKPLIDRAIELGISYLTFWAFSTENWYRSKSEVKFLLQLFRQALERRVDSFHKSNIKLNIIGDISKFPQDIQQKLKFWKEKTKGNKKITVNMALNYGGRDEIIRAIKRWHKNSEFKVQNSELTIKDFDNYLDTKGQPDPDLLIRTGGEKRLSGFLLWQMEYTELYFTETLWPEFTPTELDKALLDYSERQRRFGR